MFINRISASKSDIIDQCLFKFHDKYIKRLPGFPSKNDETLNFGSYLHRVFELGYKETFLKDLEKIAESERPKYKIPFRYDNRIKLCLENFLALNNKLGIPIHTEFKFKIPLDGDIEFEGVIDRVNVGTKGGILVIDYKSSKNEKTKIDLINDKQMQGYAFAMHQLMGVAYKDIFVAHYYPLSNNLVSVNIPESFINHWKKKEIAKVWRIRKKKADLNEWPAMKNQYCDWCDRIPVCPLHTPLHEIEANRKKQLELLVEKTVDKTPDHKPENH